MFLLEKNLFSSLSSFNYPDPDDSTKNPDDDESSSTGG